MIRLKRAAAIAAIVFAAGCTADAGDLTGPSAGPQRDIEDAAHGGAIPGFYFLPPMVQAPPFSGTFDATLQPRVEVCELSGASCGTVIAQFTFGTGSGNVRVDAGAQHYIVNWHTGSYNLDPAKHYRISVYSGSFRLGFADVDVVSSGKELKNVNTQEFIPLLDDRTLPIKFRVETGIVGQIVVSPAADTVNVGQTAQFTATLIDLHGNPVSGPAVTWTSSAPAVATVDASGLATGVSPGTVTITASLGYVSGTATLVVEQPNQPPVANPDAFEAIGNVTVPVSAPGVLANDTDPDANTLSAVAGTFATASGGTVTLNADGSFTYLSAPGFTGTDSFGYTLSDGVAEVPGTVTVEVATRVWYVSNAAAAPGDGRDASPFATLKQAESASVAGETIFVLSGNGTTVGYDEGIVLKAGQALTGQGVAADVTATLNGETVVLLAAGAAPMVARATAGTTIELATGNTVQGLNVTSSSGAGIAGSGFGTFTADRVGVTANLGPALDLQDGTAAASFTELTSLASPTAGLRLVNVGGAVSAPTGILAGAAAAGVEVTGGDANVSYGGTVTVTAGRSADITARTGGTVALSGTICDTGLGIRVENNTGGSVVFSGATKNLATGGSPAVVLANNAGSSVSFTGGGLTATGTGVTVFSATGGGTVTVTGANNAIGAVNGTALRIENTTIGVAGVTFRGISASGGVNGIVLVNTGAAGFFSVTGTGSAGSGGTIQNMSGVGVSLTDVSNVSLASLDVQNTGGSGVRGTGVVNFAFTGGAIDGSGAALGADGSNLAFNTAGASNVSGTLTITGSTLSNAYQHGVEVVNFSGSLTDVDISGNTLTSSASAADSKGSGIRLVASGSAAAAAAVQRATIAGNVVTGFPSGSGIEVRGGNPSAAGPGGVFGVAGSATNVIAVTGNRVSGASALSRMGINAINATASGKGQASFDISGNGTVADPLGNVVGTVISHSVFGQVNATATISNNRIVANNSVGAQGIGVGVDNAFGVADAPSLAVAITGNAVSQTDGNGILAVARNSSATLRADIQGNTVAAPLAGVRQGIRIDSGSTLGNTSVCLNIAGNTSAGAGGALGIGLRKQGVNPAVNAFAVQGMAATATPAVEAFVSGQNPSGGGTQLLSATSGFGNCSL